MKIENINALERLSMFCHFGGLFSVFIGMVITLMNVLNSDYKHLQTGIYIFATGYAVFKIGAKISDVLLTERDH